MKLWTVNFTDVPDHLGFVLNKHPRFETMPEAQAFLNHYAMEHGCYGEVVDLSKWNELHCVNTEMRDG